MDNNKDTPTASAEAKYTGVWLVNTQPSQEEMDAVDECHRIQDPNGLLL